MNLYALNENGELISIADVETKYNTKYYCCLCEDEMMPKKGKIRRHHFAHKSLGNCSYESYLHKVSKLKFFKEYKLCLKNKVPFYIEYKVREICTACQNIEKLNLTCKKVLIKPYDITEWFDIISMEKSFKGFVADILLESSTYPDEKIFIEFAVTHKCDVEKLNSGIRIIEIELVDEKDLQFIDNHKILISQDYTESLKSKNLNHLSFFDDFLPPINQSANNSITQHKITYHNFKIKEKSFPKYLPHKCKKEINTFMITKNNKAVRKYVEMNILIKRLNNYKYLEILGSKKSNLTRIDEGSHMDEDYENALDFEFLVKKAAFKLRDFKNCYSCRFSARNNNRHIYDVYGNVLICKLKKIVIENSNDGSKCEKYWRIEKETNQLN